MKETTPHIVQYQGSKRLLAPQILQYMPDRFERLLEPFAGMAAISIAVANANKSSKFHINDLNGPLLGVLRQAVEDPKSLIAAYQKVWSGQFEFGDEHYLHFYEVRERFNQGDKTPENMLYLLARCVKGSVRYGKDGRFNQSPDKRRHGTNPKTVARNVETVSALLKGKTVFTAWDYREVLEQARPGDLVYMDPPYQGVSNVRDNRYFSGLSLEEFASSVEALDSKGVDYIISYDGVCGDKAYGEDLPSSLNCTKMLLNAGLSSQATLLGKRSTTFEALYVSNNLLLSKSDFAHILKMKVTA